MIQSTHKCQCCGVEFSSEFDQGGAIEHNNYNNDKLLYSLASCFHRATEGAKYEFFLQSITLKNRLGNHSSFNIGLLIFECRVKWFELNGFKDVAKYLESNRCNIKKEFEKDFLIENKKELIDSILKNNHIIERFLSSDFASDSKYSSFCEELKKQNKEFLNKLTHK